MGRPVLAFSARRIVVAGLSFVLGFSFLFAAPAGAHSTLLPGAPVGHLYPALTAQGPRSASPSPASSVLSPGGFGWSNLTAQVVASPGARIGAAMAWDPADGYVLLYGGTRSGAGGIDGDTWSFANGTWSNLTAGVTGAPPKLVAAELAFDPSDQEMILFGGIASNSTVSTQTWAYHARTWTNLTGHTGATPPAAEFAALSTDTADSEVVLFGGESSVTSGWFDDSWTFKAGTWTNVTASASTPAGRLLYPESSDDPAVAGVVLRAVYAMGTQVGYATLTFSSGAWRNVSSLATGDGGHIFLGGGGYLAPIGAATFVSSLAFNITGAALHETNTAEFSNTTWANVTPEVGGPPHYEELGSVSDLPSDQGLLAFGGVNPTTGAFTGETWVLTAAPQLQALVAHVAIDAGLPDTFSSQVTGGFAPLAYHWSFGDSATSAAAAPSHSFAHAGLYQANLTVVDGVGHSVTASLWIQVEPTLAATAQASPAPATAGSPVALIGSWTGGLPPYTFSWTLGDANSSTAASLAHVYAKAGNFSATFTVTDALGVSASQPITVSVHPAASTTSSSSSSSSVSLSSGTGLYLLLGLVLLAAVAAVLAALLARRPRSPPGPPSPYGGAPPAASYGGPPSPPPGAAPPS